MSHFTVIVVGSNLEAQLKPFDENISVDEYVTGIVSDSDKQSFLDHYNCSDLESAYEIHGDYWNSNSWKHNDQGVWVEMSTYNPKSKWDWYAIGGRWENYFLDSKGKGHNSLKKKDVNIPMMKRNAYRDGINYYKKIAGCFPNNKIPKVEKTWDQLREEMEGADIGMIRSVYHTQPTILLLNELRNKYTDLIWIDIEDFHQFNNCEEFAQSESDKVPSTYAIVKDGVWYEKGKMGWFGISSGDKPDWQKTFNEIWDSINPNDLVTLVDCHI